MYSLLIWWIFVLTFSPYVFHVNICSCCACANRGWAKTKTKMTTSTATTTASRMTNDGKWWWEKMRQRQTHTYIHWIAFNFIFSMPFFSLHFSSSFIHFIFFCSFDHFTFCQLTKAFGCCNTRDALAISKWKYCLYGWKNARCLVDRSNDDDIGDSPVKLYIFFFFCSMVFSLLRVPFRFSRCRCRCRSSTTGLHMNFRSSKAHTWSESEREKKKKRREGEKLDNCTAQTTTKILCILGFLLSCVLRCDGRRYSPVLLVTGHVLRKNATDIVVNVNRMSWSAHGAYVCMLRWWCVCAISFLAHSITICRVYAVCAAWCSHLSFNIQIHIMRAAYLFGAIGCRHELYVVHIAYT